MSEMAGFEEEHMGEAASLAKDQQIRKSMGMKTNLGHRPSLVGPELAGWM
jgi:hypothetical protein